MLTSLSELPLPSQLPVIPLLPVKNAPHAINRSTASFTQEELALIKLGRRLRQADYHFITVTPDTHRLVNARSANESARDVRDIFGWNRPFSHHVLPQSMWNDLQNTEVFEPLEDGRFRSRVRFSTIDEQLILHSGFPTVTQDAVFFGPDTYRFVQHLRRFVGAGSALLEIGAGTGAAALCFGERFKHLVMTDINPRAVRCARINAALAGYTQAEVVCADIAGAMTGSFDAIIANPPYMIDPHKRWYRDGGCLGIALTLRMVLGALPLLAPGGRLVFSFLELEAPTHWAVFDGIVAARKAGVRKQVDMFLHRDQINAWARRNDFDTPTYIHGTDERATSTGMFGQSVVAMKRK